MTRGKLVFGLAKLLEGAGLIVILLSLIHI